MAAEAFIIVSNQLYFEHLNSKNHSIAILRQNFLLNQGISPENV
jgi:hypothetical protein